MGLVVDIFAGGASLGLERARVHRRRMASAHRGRRRKELHVIKVEIKDRYDSNKVLMTEEVEDGPEPTRRALEIIVARHRKWIAGEDGGVRANLVRANLVRANLDGANLVRANLVRANLYGANLVRANLYGANLDGANLYGANLYGANLDGAKVSDAGALDAIRDDIYEVLSHAPDDVPGLLAALKAGKVDDSVYEGPCACLVGTIRNVRAERTKDADLHFESLDGIKPDGSRPAERWFMGIRKGHLPSISMIAALTVAWIEAWLARNQRPSVTEAPNAADAVVEA